VVITFLSFHHNLCFSSALHRAAPCVSFCFHYSLVLFLYSGI
jgi:hypothetical protein